MPEKVSDAELRSFVERVERVEVELRNLSDDRKEIYSEAKWRGYDAKILRQIVALRKKDPQALSEEEAVLAMYKDALGM